MNKKTAVVVGAAPVGNEKSYLNSILNSNDSYKIAADGGIKFFLEAGIEPDYWIGDMDSTAELNINPEQVDKKISRKIVPVKKDDTDLGLALDLAVKNGCKDIFVFGALGGKRFSHSFANIQLLKYYSQKVSSIVMVGEGTELRVITDSFMEFDENTSGYVSVFSLTPESKNVSIKNLLYEFEGSLTDDFPLGVSNQFIGKPARISVKKGSLLIVKETL